MARAYRREKELKERGEGEGMALRDTIAQEAFSPTSMGSMMMGGVSHDVGGSVERDTLAAALAQQAADGEPSATMAAMAGIAAVESGIESAKTAARLAASNTNNNNGAVPMPPAHSREMAVKAAGAASAAGDGNGNLGAGMNGNAELSPTSHTLRAMAALQAKKGKVSV